MTNCTNGSRKSRLEQLPSWRLWKPYLRRRSATNRNRVVEYYQPIVANEMCIKRRFTGKRGGDDGQLLSDQDLIQAGLLRLIRCVERFDPRRGVLFETYFARCLRGAFMEAYNRWRFGPNKPSRDPPLQVNMLSLQDAEQELESVRGGDDPSEVVAGREMIQRLEAGDDTLLMAAAASCGVNVRAGDLGTLRAAVFGARR